MPRVFCFTFFFLFKGMRLFKEMKNVPFYRLRRKMLYLVFFLLIIHITITQISSFSKHEGDTNTKSTHACNVPLVSLSTPKSIHCMHLFISKVMTSIKVVFAQVLQLPLLLSQLL